MARMKVRLGIVGGAALALAALQAPTTARADDTRCTGVLSGVHDNVVVPEGAFCTLVGANVRGNVNVFARATLVAVRSQIGGNVESEFANFTDLRGGNSVVGSVSVYNSLVWSDICGNEIGQNVIVQYGGRNSGLRSGLSSTFCFPRASNRIGGKVHVEKTAMFQDVEGDEIGGDLLILENTALSPRLLNNNTVGGNMQVFKNMGAPTSIVRNVIQGALQCGENAPPPTVAANTAAQQQCPEEISPAGATAISIEVVLPPK
jgi:hypothetical protein